MAVTTKMGGVILTQTDHGLEALKKALREAQARESYVKVGVLGSKATAAHPGAKLTNVQLAAIHEFGVPERGIPERSFIRSTFGSKRREYVQHLHALLRRFYEGKVTLEHVLKVMGLKASSDMKKRIYSNDPAFAPLSPKTIAAKGSSKPLIDTAMLVRSIDFEVVAAGAGATAHE